MNISGRARQIFGWLAVGGGAAAGAYLGYAGVAWLRYGRPAPADGDEGDVLLDVFMPTYEVVERHHIQVEAPAAVTLAAAEEMDIEGPMAVRGLFKAREWILGADPDSAPRPRGLLPFAKALGWGVLAEVPGREIVMGAVTQPWEANVVFRAVSPDDFAAFWEPGYAKIVWTLRADPAGPWKSIFRTETRVVTTDQVARTKFRRYWAFLSPGIILIRWISLAPLKAAAERRMRAVEPTGAKA